MKPLRYLFFTLAAALVSPAVIGMVDAWAWLMTGGQVSWMDWNRDRVMTAWAFLFLAAGAAFAAFGMRDAADR